MANNAPGIGRTNITNTDTAPQIPSFNISPHDYNDMVNTVIAEAGGEGLQGMLGVANVMANRARLRNQSIGDVIRAPKQFTGYEQPGAGALKMMHDPRIREQAVSIVNGVLSGQIGDNTGGADHYHADYVNPSWAKSMPQTTSIGAHIFYNSNPAKTNRTTSNQPQPSEPLGYAPERQKGEGEQAIDQMLTGSIGSNNQQIDNEQAAKFLMPRLKGHGAEHITAMQPQFQVALANMIQNAPPEIASGLEIFSGTRTVERQTQLWEDALKKYGSVAEARKWVAPPPGVHGSTGSRHNHGNAADLSWNGQRIDKAPAEVREWLHKNAAQFGLSFPLGNEAWHIEAADARSGKGQASPNYRDRLRGGETASRDMIIDPMGMYRESYGKPPVNPASLPNGEIGIGDQGQAELAKGVFSQEQADFLTKRMNEQYPGRFTTIEDGTQDQWLEDWDKTNRSQSFAGDVPILLGKGFQGLVDSVAHGVKAIPGIGEPIYNSMNWLDEAATGKTTQQISDDNHAWAEAHLSNATREARKKEWITDDYGLGDAWTDWRAVAAGVTESIPSTAATMVPAGWMARGAKLRALASGATEAAAIHAATRTATLAGAISEGFLTGGGTAKAVSDEMRALPREVFEKSEAVQSLIAQGKTFDEAVNIITGSAEGQAMLLGGFSGAVFGGMGDRALAKIIADKAGSGVARSALRGMLKGTVGEGLFEEMPQEVGQQMAQNKAMQEIDPERSLMEGVPNAAAGGAIIGGAMGGGMGGTAGLLNAGPLRNAVDYGLEAENTRMGNGETEDAPMPQQAVETQASEATYPDIPVGQSVRIAEEGMEPFTGNVTNVGNGYADIVNPETGETITAPVNILQPASMDDLPTVPTSNTDTGPEADEQRLQEEYAAQAPEVEAYEAETSRTEPVAKPKQQRLKKQVKQGEARNVIVEMPGHEQFLGRIVYWEGNDALVKRKDGTDISVPMDYLFQDGRTAKEIEAEDLAAHPPVERETPKGKTIRRFANNYLEFPDDLHTRLYDLGKIRESAIRSKEASAFQLNQKPMGEQLALAKAFGVLPDALGNMADDYRHTVEKRLLERKSKLPIKMQSYYPKRLEQYKRDKSRKEGQADLPLQSAPQAPVQTSRMAERWQALAPAERKRLLDLGNIKRSPKHGWNDLTKTIQNKLEKVIAADDAAITAKAIETAKELRLGQSAKPQAETAEQTTAEPDNAYADKWFGSQDKAEAFIAKKSIGTTHEAVQSGKRFEIRLKEQQPEADNKPTVTKHDMGGGVTGFVIDPTGGKPRINDTKTAKPRLEISENRLVSEDVFKAAQERLMNKLKNQLNSGVDPEMFKDGIIVTAYHIERGARTFAAYAKLMVETMGDVVKPYLKQWYTGTMLEPSYQGKLTGMTPIQEVMDADIEAILATDEKAETDNKEAEPEPNPRRKRAPDRPLDAINLQDRSKLPPSKDVRLKKDYGVDQNNLNEYTDEGTKAKAAFLSDATRYLKAVAVEMEAHGYEPLKDKKGKPEKPVYTNTGGVAGSGEVNLHLLHPETSLHAYIKISGIGGMIGVPNNKSGIAVMYRASKQKYGVQGQNQWTGIELTASELADKLLEVADWSTRLDARKKAVENGQDRDRHQLSGDDKAGAPTLEGTSAETLRGAGENGNAGRVADNGGRADLGRDGGTDTGGNRPAHSVDGHAAELPHSGSGGDRGRGRVNVHEDVENGEGIYSDEERSPKTGRGPDLSDGPAGRSGRLDNKNDRQPAGGLTALERPDDYHTISADDHIGEGGQKTKFRANIDAIKILKSLEAEQRPPSREEQKQLARWVGWGGLPQAFYKENGTTTKGWEKEAAELKTLLTPEEYSAAESSTRNAHYTALQVVTAMWKIMQRLGLKSGRVLEPSVGAGNFLGLMPVELRKNAQITGVELDHITGGIAKYLYPKANIQAPLGFQDFSVPDNYFDVVIGNPPFGSERLYDSTRRHLNRFSIHNYFFAKSIDTLRPGGIAMMVVTNSFLDAARDKARLYIADRADLVAAIRLPNNAFLKNAGTQVTTDIIILQKRGENDSAADTSWLDIGTHQDGQGRQVPLNQYFVNHPEMMLGEFGAYGSMYHGDAPALIAREGTSLDTLLDEAIARLPQSIIEESGSTIIPEKVVATGNVRTVAVGSFFTDEKGDIHIREQDHLNEPQSSPATFANDKARQRVKGMIKLRDAFTTLRAAQLNENTKEADLKKLRDTLNKVYDGFVKKHQPVNARANMLLFRDDPTWPQIAALEDKFDKGLSPAQAAKTGEPARAPSAKKAAIFSKRTQAPYRKPEKAETAKDALAFSLAEYGTIDRDYMAKLYGKSPDSIIKELGDLVFETPEGGYVTADDYLSGNVRKKLMQAQEAAKSNPNFQRNITALENVIPADIEAVDIDAKAGSPWIPAKHIKDFVSHIAGVDDAAHVSYSSYSAKWALDGTKWTDAASVQWATERANLETVLEAALNGTVITIRDKQSNDTYVVNPQASELANEKVAKVKQEWARWIWQDNDRREELGRMYNDTFNSVVLRHFDGSHLSLPGKIGDDIINLRPHQKNFIWRTLQSSTSLADHTVGAGKTFALIASAMEMRRMGRARKPMFVVPNHLVGQWASDFIRLYPGANVLAATKKDFEKNNRKKFFARVATGDWDAVIVAHSSFGKINTSIEYQRKFIDATIADLENSISTIEREEGKNARSIKQLTKWRDREKEKLKRLMDSGGKDDGLVFDELGVDALFVDEAHEFKNLSFSTSMTRVAGLGNPQGSQKAADLFTKIRFVLDKTGGRNIVFATGTPISNSMAEMFTMQRYLDYEGLVEQSIAHFDAWARVFGEVVTDWELSPSGQYKLNSRFSKFVNMPELMQRYLSFGDVITNDDIQKQLSQRGEKLPIPKIRGGKPEPVIVERSPDQANYVGEPETDEQGNEYYPQGSLVWRSENLPKKPEKGADNMLKIMSDARKAALDMRLIDPAYGDYAGSKSNIAVKRIKSIYDKWHEQKGTQLVFCDLSTPKGARAGEELRIRQLIERADNGDEDAAEALEKISPDEISALDSQFSVYDDMKAKLIKAGIPETEIAFIHDANTDDQKQELFGKVRSGRVRIMFGSTPKMGAGTNVQNRLVALHHMDAPWRPSDLEQRDGRGIRQGNELYEADPEGFEIEILRYATKNTLDARQWQTIETKAKFVQQIRKGDMNVREIEDISGEAANAAEMKAAASGNPLILEEMDLRRKLRKLESQQQEHDREQHRINGRIRNFNRQIERNETKLPKAEGDAEKALSMPEKFTIKVKDTIYDKRTDAGSAIVSMGRKLVESKGETVKIGDYAGFEVHWDNAEILSYPNQIDMRFEGNDSHSMTINDISAQDAAGLTIKMANFIGALAEVPARLEKENLYAHHQIKELEKQITDWPHEEELADIAERHRAVIDELKPKKKEIPEATTESETPEKRFSIKAGRNGVQRSLKTGYLGQFIDRLMENSRLVIHDRAQDIKDAQGWTDKDGRIHLVAENIAYGEAQAVLLHEAFHSGVRPLIGDVAWNGLIKDLNALYNQFGKYPSGKSMTGARRFYDEARARVARAKAATGELSIHMTAEEFGAYAVEEFERAPGALVRWGAKLVGHIKVWVLKRFGRQLGTVTPAELRALAIAALKQQALTGATTNESSSHDRRYSILSKVRDKIGEGVTVSRVVEDVKGRMTDAKPILLKTIPLNYFTELAQPNMTAVQAYMKKKRALDAYRGEKHAEADAIAQRWLKYSRLGKAKVEALSTLMHEATVSGIDPSMSDDANTALPGYSALRKRFLSLPKTGQQLFTDVRDAYRKQSKELDLIILENIEKVHAIAEEKLEAEYAKEIERIQKSKLDDLGKRQAVEEVERAFKTRKQRSLWSMKARLLRMRDAFEASRVTGPYFPLARFGQYYVTVKDAQGEVISFSRREHAADRDRLAADMKKAYPNMSVESGLLSSERDVKAALDPRMIAEMETILGGSALSMEETSTVIDQIWQRYLQLMPDLSVRKRFIHRKGTAGFDSDALRAFSSHMFHAAHQMGRLKYEVELSELVNKTTDQAKQAKDTTKAMQLAYELRSRHQWVMKPTGSKFAQTMTSTAFVWYLAATPAAAIVNMSQTPMMGIPILGARFGGLTKAAGAIAKASLDSIAGRGSVERANLTADEKQAMKAFYESGLIDRTQSHDLAGVGETGVEYSPLRAKVMGIISWMFHRAEVWNREVTALAAYRMARQSGQSMEMAIDTAHDLTWKTHFDYSNSSRPAIMQNDFAKVALVFRSHNINMIYRVSRDLHQAFKGETRETRREARIQLAGIFGMMALFAGTTGVMGFNIAMTILGAAFGDDDDPYDFQQRYKAAVLDLLGPELGGVVLNGLPGHYLGVDLTSRIGMPDIWFRSPPKDLQGQDEFEYYIMNSLGAGVSMIGSAWRGVSLIKEGNVARGLETISPKWTRDLMRGWRYHNEGLTSLRGDPVLARDDLDAWDIIAQTVGFTPAKVAETYERNGALKTAEQRIVNQRRSLINAWALAVASKNDEARHEAMEAIKRFNAIPRNRAVRITNKSLIQSFRQRQTIAKKREDGVLIQNKDLGAGLRQELPASVYR